MADKGEEIQGPPLTPPGDERDAELARADAARADDSDIDGQDDGLPPASVSSAPVLVCPICELSSCSHNLPYTPRKT